MLCHSPLFSFFLSFFQVFPFTLCSNYSPTYTGQHGEKMTDLVLLPSSHTRPLFNLFYPTLVNLLLFLTLMVLEHSRPKGSFLLSSLSLSLSPNNSGITITTSIEKILQKQILGNVVRVYDTPQVTRAPRW